MGFYIRVTTRPAPKPEYTFLTNNKHFLNTVSTQTTISNALLYIPMTTTRKKDTQKSLYYSILIQTWFMLVPGSKLPEFSRLLLEKKSEVKGWHWVIFVRDTLGYLFLTGCFNISSTSPQLIAHKCWGGKKQQRTFIVLYPAQFCSGACARSRMRTGLLELSSRGSLVPLSFSSVLLGFLYSFTQTGLGAVED